MNLLLVAILTGVDFTLLYLLIPNISVLLVMGFILIFPGIINGYFYSKENKKINILIYPVITALIYSICAYFLQSSGKIVEFAKLANMNTGELVVNINTNITGIDMIVFSFLLQAAILFVVNILTRRKVNDKSYSVKQNI